MRMNAGWPVRTLALGIAIAGCAACSRGGGEEPTMNDSPRRIVRQAVGAGRWFPGSRNELQGMVDGFIAEARVPAVTGRIVSAIAPHAGYIYSGRVAGYTYRAIRDSAAAGNKPDTVVVLGFSHRGAFSGVALMDGDALETPLGPVDLDAEAGKLLTLQSDRIRFYFAPHAGEHSAENQLPFVQTALPGTKVVVGLVGDHDAKTLEALLAALNELAKAKKILVIASTDLLHDPDYDLVARTDRTTLAKIAALDDAGLASSWSADRQVCCGIGPVLTAMRFARSQGCTRGTTLHYRNSGDDYPDSRGNWVVGYGSVVFTPAK
jgi:AmmeMemoRadiSam system protein B